MDTKPTRNLVCHHRKGKIKFWAHSVQESAVYWRNARYTTFFPFADLNAAPRSRLGRILFSSLCCFSFFLVGVSCPGFITSVYFSAFYCLGSSWALTSVLQISPRPSEMLCRSLPLFHTNGYSPLFPLPGFDRITPNPRKHVLKK